MECVGIEDKISQKQAAMYESDLKFYHSWKKGYQATLSDFFRKPTTAPVG